MVKRKFIVSTDLIQHALFGSLGRSIKITKLKKSKRKKLYRECYEIEVEGDVLEHFILDIETDKYDKNPLTIFWEHMTLPSVVGFVPFGFLSTDKGALFKRGLRSLFSSEESPYKTKVEVNESALSYGKSRQEQEAEASRREKEE